VPLATSRVLRLRVPATGCAYGGTVGVTYGRLPAGSQKQQQALVERAGRTNNAEYSFVYRPDGGFVIAGAAVTMPTQRPAAAKQCVPDPFRFGVTSP
jgi:peptidoglycan hydrolase-like protein with peptidoglycan-binding domain